VSCWFVKLTPISTAQHLLSKRIQGLWSDMGQLTPQSVKTEATCVKASLQISQARHDDQDMDATDKNMKHLRNTVSLQTNNLERRAQPPELEQKRSQRLR